MTCSFLPPTILKMMRASDVDYSRTGLRAAFSGGEALGGPVAEWARRSLGIRVNEIYGRPNSISSWAPATPLRHPA